MFAAVRDSEISFLPSDEVNLTSFVHLDVVFFRLISLVLLQQRVQLLELLGLLVVDEELNGQFVVSTLLALHLDPLIFLELGRRVGTKRVLLVTSGVLL